MGIVDFGYYKQLRVDHSQHELCPHINSIEGFLGYAKVRLTRVKGNP